MVKIVVPEDDLRHFTHYLSNIFTENVEAVFVFSENVEEHVPWLCPWVPEITSNKKVHKSSKNSWWMMRLFRSFQEYLQSCSMENQYKSLKVDYIYRSIQEDVPSSLHWFLFVHPSSVRIKQNEQLQNLFLSMQLAYLDFYLYLITFLILYLSLYIYIHWFRNKLCYYMSPIVIIIMYSEYLHYIQNILYSVVIGLLYCLTYLLHCWKPRHYWRFIIFIGK